MTLPALAQALDDFDLHPTAIRVLWVLHRRLDTMEWRVVKIESLATECRMKFGTASHAVHVLTARGYLDARPRRRREREYRLFVSRREQPERRAPESLPLFQQAA